MKKYIYFDSDGKKLSDIKLGDEFSAIKIDDTEISKTEMIVACNRTVTIQGSKNFDQVDDFEVPIFRKGRFVEIDAYAVGEYQVTQKLYAQVMKSDENSNAYPSRWKDTPYRNENQDNLPVENITWYDAVYFCNRLTVLTMGKEHCVYTIEDEKRDDEKHIINASVEIDISKKGYRLPTEAEWEYAARGGEASSYYFLQHYSGAGDFSIVDDETGDQNDLDTVAWWLGTRDEDVEDIDNDNESAITHEVGLKKPNALNCFDMSGNVWEWCCDWYSKSIQSNPKSIVRTGSLGQETVHNPCGPESGDSRVIRGGCAASQEWCCAVCFRNDTSPDLKGRDVGLRLVRTL